jgi:hypothetical protein
MMHVSACKRHHQALFYKNISEEAAASIRLFGRSNRGAV